MNWGRAARERVTLSGLVVRLVGGNLVDDNSLVDHCLLGDIHFFHH